MDSSKKRKRKAYIISSNPNKKKKSNCNLVAGMRGFICTCNGYEKGCIREALNILDEYDSKLNSTHVSSKPIEQKNDDSDDDIEKQLKKEIVNEKSENKFKLVDTGANNCLFISAKVNNVIEMAEKIMTDAKKAILAKSRFLIRLVPIEITCKAYNDDIKKAADEIFDSHFKCEPLTYCIHVNKRSNNNLLRMEVTDDLVRLVRDRNIKHTVDLKNPNKTVIVEIIRNICCLSVVNNFFEFRKFNLIELGNPKNANQTDNTSNNEGKDCALDEKETEKNVMESVEKEIQSDEKVLEDKKELVKKEVQPSVSQEDPTHEEDPPNKEAQENSVKKD